MSSTLYRKYRPQKFSEIIGQNAIRTTLKNELEKSQFAHAYLFSGPRGSGKTSTARILAKSLNCLKRKEEESEPCNECESCVEITEGNALDLIEIDAASHTGVDNVRENIINHSRVFPVQRKFKVFIIDEVHMLSISAFNALLKTLEEPPRHVVFILATTETHKVPQTIVSRCQHFDFRRVSAEDIEKRILDIAQKEKITLDKEVVELIASHAEGSVRDAESMLGQILSLGSKHVTLDQASIILPYSDIEQAIQYIELLSEKNIASALELISKLSDDGVDMQVFLKDVISMMRKILFTKASASRVRIGVLQKHEKKVQKLAKNLEMKRLVFMIEIFLEKLEELKNAELPTLSLEIGTVQICMDDETPKKDENNGDDYGNTLKKIQEVPKENIVKKKKIQNDEKPPEQVPAVKEHFSLEQIRQNWDGFLKKIKEHSHSLFSFMRSNQPLGVSENTVKIGVVFDFHRERIQDRKNKVALEKILSEILGKTIFIECVKVESIVDFEKAIELHAKNENAVKSLAEAFGGVLLE